MWLDIGVSISDCLHRGVGVMVRRILSCEPNECGAVVLQVSRGIYGWLYARLVW